MFFNEVAYEFETTEAKIESVLDCMLKEAAVRIHGYDIRYFDIYHQYEYYTGIEGRVVVMMDVVIGAETCDSVVNMMVGFGDILGEISNKWNFSPKDFEEDSSRFSPEAEKYWVKKYGFELE